MSRQYRASMPIRPPVFLRGYGESRPDDNTFKMFPAMKNSQPAMTMSKCPDNLWAYDGMNDTGESTEPKVLTVFKAFRDNRPYGGTPRYGYGGSLRSPIMQQCPVKIDKQIAKTEEWERIPIEAIDDVLDQLPSPDHDIGHFSGESDTETVLASKDFDESLSDTSSMARYNLGDRRGFNRQFRPPKTATYVPAKKHAALELTLAINLKYNCVLSDEIYGDVMISKDGELYVQHGKEVYKLHINPKNWFTWGQRQFGCNQFQGYKMSTNFVANYGHGPVKKAKTVYKA